jgi:hypothetical protein
LQDVIERDAEVNKMLTGNYFARNRIDPQARLLKYADFPRYYTWHARTKEWKPRQRGSSIGRIYSVFPSDPERWYLQLLLNHVCEATSFEDIRVLSTKVSVQLRWLGFSWKMIIIWKKQWQKQILQCLHLICGDYLAYY